ncbi:hypothetical protein D3C83_192010 [compost metagenome]
MLIDVRLANVSVNYGHRTNIGCNGNQKIAESHASALAFSVSEWRNMLNAIKIQFNRGPCQIADP